MIVEPIEGAEGMMEKVEVALSSMVGFSESQTIKMLGTIQDQWVVALIDGGATHNFIARVIVDELRLLIAPTIAYDVRLGNGKSV